jgi:hypothetical protein
MVKSQRNAAHCGDQIALVKVMKGRFHNREITATNHKLPFLHPTSEKSLQQPH